MAALTDAEVEAEVDGGAGNYDVENDCAADKFFVKINRRLMDVSGCDEVPS